MEAARAGGDGNGFVLLGDQPYGRAEDPLGFDEIAEDLSGLILASRGSTPFTLGIEGAWGTGKSTLMARLCARLSQEPPIEPVLFNAWTADNGGVLEGLVKTVLNELDPNVLRRAMRNRKLISGLRLSAGVVAGLFGVGNVVDTIWGRAIADPRARNELRDLVAKGVEAWREKLPELAGDRMLCVFIDDLDRCSPQGVLEVFEAMKLYLDVPGIVFVIGYDQDIVSDLVLKEKGYSEAIRSRDYLEKFIQIVYRIPRPVTAQSSSFIESLLRESGTEALFGDVERDLVIDGSRSNPRRVKRFINAFVLAYGLDPGWREFRPQSLIRVQLLQMYFPEFARMLEHPSERDPAEEFLDYRRAREALRRRQGLGARETIEKVLVGIGLGVTREMLEADPDGVLKLLEENVAVSFVALADREDFCSLVQSLAEASDWSALRAALAEGALPSLSPPLSEGEEQPPSLVEQLLRSRELEGLRILWVDDEMERNELLAHDMEERGAHLSLTTSREEMVDALEKLDFDVLISDIYRPGAPEGGLDAVQELAGQTPRTVIFFTSRVTQSRLDRAHRLGATLVNDEASLMGLLRARSFEKRRANPVVEFAPEDSGAG